ncbi:multicopper oxidase family protein [Luteibacter sp.]|jgi:FtsP/CotA-like multicopper oxidase with cupredoxin domain|uniref:multicopper oxidase family protein n=1 Tax=Luteibacter sp. TaxID=1886636 RepID=UPI002F3FE51F
MKSHRDWRWCLGIVLAAFAAAAPYAAPATEDLREPKEFTYGADGVTTVTLTAALSKVMIGNTPYESLVFNGDYDAPVIRTKPGGTIRLTLDNQMDELTNLHFHGMQVSPLDEGDSIFRLTDPHTKGQYVLRLPPEHSPGPYWYHSHFNKGAERQVSGGISGPILVDGIKDQFPELRDVRERMLVLRNFQKTFTGRLASEIVTGSPSIRTINGQYQPDIHLRPGETQLWHLFNVDANQYFRIRMGGLRVQIISQDADTVVKEVFADELLLGPSARVSILVTGPAPGRYALTLGRANTGPAGDSYARALLGTLVSEGETMPTVKITSAYPQARNLTREPIAARRRFVFQDSEDNPNAFFINGRRFDPERVDTTVKLGDIEEWTLFNPSQELHQFHIHQLDFQVTKLNGKPVDFIGYRDNVFIPALGSITLRIPFIDPVILGKFVYHCHIMEHEDGGMMQVIQVVRPADYDQAVKLEPLGGIYGDNQTCAYLRNTGRTAIDATAPAPARPLGGSP